MSRQCTHYGRWPQHGFTSLKKLRPQSVTSRIQPGSDVIVCAEMDEHWGYVGAKSRQRWLFYAYDRIRGTVVAHVFGERTLATLERLLSLLSAFEVVVWMTDGGFAPIFPDICYHLTHYKPAAADIPVASDNPAHYADAIRYNARTPLQGSLLPLTRLVWA
ncbi:IS1 orfB [Shigella flexneri]|nr:IS1 orfB [Shigella flexneri 2002017]SRG24774.1 IS1 orfB [Shigella flexneri 2a]SRJ57248.1 IS1 orfB [Shigella flexneri]SRG28745.1 IS1 orfB [Shigella flexneri 2a]SRG61947.1 IS1 orfB [Shigella flexneri 2a]